MSERPTSADTPAAGRGPSGGELSGLRVTVMGLGLFGGGSGAARWAHAQGAHVTVTDLRSRGALRTSLEGLRDLTSSARMRFTLGEHRDEDFADAEVVIVNPAVPPQAPHLATARAAGARITTATELLLERVPCPVVAITGTNGKSSTANFTRDLLIASRARTGRVLLGGNIGGSLLDELEALRPEDAVVLELSSYQLEHLDRRMLDRDSSAVRVVAITNIGVDHLERHGTLESYRAAKRRLLRLVGSGGTAVVPASERAAASAGGGRVVVHGPAPRALSGTPPDEPSGAAQIDGRGVIRVDGVALGSARDLRVPGTFQRDNLVVALAAAHALGAHPRRLGNAIPALRGLPHRMEGLGQYRGRASGASFEVIDNGVSTTPESTIAALESAGAGAAPLVWLGGGQLKRGVGLDALAAAAGATGARLVPFGAAAATLASAVERRGGRVLASDRDGHAQDVEEATRRAVAASGEGAVLLFSPACASFDGYANFRARATAFRRALEAAADALG